MSKFQHDVMLKIVKIIDLVMITIPFALCWELYYSYRVYAKFGWKGNWAMIGLFAVLFFLLGKVYDAFWMSMQRVSELVYGQILGSHGNRWHSVHCHLPDGPAALQSSAGHRSDCRTDPDGLNLGEVGAWMVL